MSSVDAVVEEAGMVEEPIRVQTGELRAAAGRLAENARRLGGGLAGEPELLVAAPGWRATEALAGLEAAVHGWLCRLGVRVAAGATGLRSAADEYDAVDSRAARRLADAPR